MTIDTDPITSLVTRVLHQLEIGLRDKPYWHPPTFVSPLPQMKKNRNGLRGVALLKYLTLPSLSHSKKDTQTRTSLALCVETLIIPTTVYYLEMRHVHMMVDNYSYCVDPGHP